MAILLPYSVTLFRLCKAHKACWARHKFGPGNGSLMFVWSYWLQNQTHACDAVSPHPMPKHSQTLPIRPADLHLYTDLNSNKTHPTFTPENTLKTTWKHSRPAGHHTLQTSASMPASDPSSHLQPSVCDCVRLPGSLHFWSGVWESVCVCVCVLFHDLHLFL